MKTNDTDQKQSDDKPFMFRFMSGFVSGPEFRKLKLIEHRLLWIMLDYANNTDGTFFLGINHACERTGMDSGDVRRAENGLIAKGIVRKVRQGGGRNPGSNKGLATTWQLLVSPVDKPVRDDLTGGETAPVSSSALLGGKRVDTGGKTAVTGGKTAPSTTHPQGLNSTTHPLRVGGSSKANTSKDTTTRSERKRLRLGDDKRSPTSETLSDIELALMDATGICQNGDARPVWLEQLTKAVAKLPDEAWDSLPADAQWWLNDAVVAIKASSPIPDPATFVDDKIIRRLREYGVTHVARLLLENQGADWCRTMLAVCDKQKKKDGGDPTVASYWCKKFAKNPDGFDPDRGKNVSDDDAGEDESEDEDDVRGDGQLPDVDVGEDEDREAKHYRTRQEREEELAMVGES